MRCTSARSRPRWPGPDAGPHSPRRRSARRQRACRRSFTAGHSSAMMEKRAEVRTVSSAPGRSPRMIPSSFPPMRSMAAQDRLLRTSVCSATRCTSHTSKAWVIISSFASVLTGVRWADAARNVNPMSRTSGTPARWWRAPGGQSQKETQKRVEPTTRSRLAGRSWARRTVAKATWSPWATCRQRAAHVAASVARSRRARRPTGSCCGPRPPPPRGRDVGLGEWLEPHVGALEREGFSTGMHHTSRVGSDDAAPATAGSGASALGAGRRRRRPGGRPAPG